jgi:predicted RNA-binding Zn-ribbon protein involved in translation (DUF1610 family)
MNKSEIVDAIEIAFEKFGDGARMTRSALTGIVFNILNPNACMSDDEEDFIYETICEEINVGNLGAVIGKAGGIFKPLAVHTNTVRAAQKNNSVAINDHVCPACGNDRVSKREKSCWKCGNSLH